MSDAQTPAPEASPSPTTESPTNGMPAAALPPAAAAPEDNTAASSTPAPAPELPPAQSPKPFAEAGPTPVTDFPRPRSDLRLPYAIVSLRAPLKPTTGYLPGSVNVPLSGPEARILSDLLGGLVEVGELNAGHTVAHAVRWILKQIHAERD